MNSSRQTAFLSAAFAILTILLPTPLARAVPPVAFSSATNYVVGTNPLCVAVANVNGSGLPDIIVGAQYGNLITTLLNTDGVFNLKTNTSITNAFGSPVSLAIEDFNHDGILDLALAREYPPAGIAPVTVLLGRGDGSFVWATNYSPGGYYSIAAGDLNNDNNPQKARDC